MGEGAYGTHRKRTSSAEAAQRLTVSVILNVVEAIRIYGNKSSPVLRVQYIHEATFALNVAFVTMGLVFVYASYAVIRPLNQLEFSVNRSLHIRQTDYMRGYWEFFLPGVIVPQLGWPSCDLSYTVITF